MKLFCFIAALFLTNTGWSQEYNEEAVLNELDGYISNPKEYYDMVQALNKKVEESNNNMLEVSEEYLGILDKKDSIIKLYKAANEKLMREKSAGGNAVASEKPVKTTTAQAENYDDKYRVQLSSFTKKDFQKFFNSASKYFGIEDHGDRNAMDIRGFNTAEEAFEFSQKMRKIGFPGAFVTKYDEGKRDFNYDYLVEAGIKSPSRSVSAINKKYNLDYPDHTPLGYQEIMNNPGENEEIPYKVDSYKMDESDDNSNSDYNSSFEFNKPSIKSSSSYSSDPDEEELNEEFNKLFSR